MRIYRHFILSLAYHAYEENTPCSRTIYTHIRIIFIAYYLLHFNIEHSTFWSCLIANASNFFATTELNCNEMRYVECSFECMSYRIQFHVDTENVLFCSTVKQIPCINHNNYWLNALLGISTANYIDPLKCANTQFDGTVIWNEIYIHFSWITIFTVGKWSVSGKYTGL